uniref:Uncharacterized protein n=1 Tax=Oncorhynchus mykiss TaxID=8022 RepID=A0A8C7P5I0_ONCMY
MITFRRWTVLDSECVLNCFVSVYMVIRISTGIVLVFTFSCSGNFKPGVYAVTVTGRLPPGILHSSGKAFH